MGDRAAFCHFWHLSPLDYKRLTVEEAEVFMDYMTRALEAESG